MTRPWYLVYSEGATAGTDTGHNAANEPDAKFAYPSPANPNAIQKKIDFAYRAVHETAVLAKKIIETYYGGALIYSYFLGCSTGGRQALMEAQRFPNDFDGIVVGAPILDHTGAKYVASLECSGFIRGRIDKG